MYGELAEHIAELMAENDRLRRENEDLKSILAEEKMTAADIDRVVSYVRSMSVAQTQVFSTDRLA